MHVNKEQDAGSMQLRLKIAARGASAHKSADNNAALVRAARLLRRLPTEATNTPAYLLPANRVRKMKCAGECTQRGETRLNLSIQNKLHIESS